jgi:hypothetical protein
VGRLRLDGRRIAGDGCSVPECHSPDSAREVHLRAARPEPNHLSPRYPGLRMASAHAPDEEHRDVTSANASLRCSGRWARHHVTCPRH